MPTNRIARLRHLRHRDLDGLDRGSPGRSRIPRLDVWLAERAATLGPTAALTTFTAAPVTNIFSAVAHGFATPEGPMVVTSAGTLPDGLSSDELYFVRIIDVDTFFLHRSREDAARGERVVDVTDAGTGAHSIARAADIPGLIEWLRRDPINSERLQATTDIDDLPV